MKRQPVSIVRPPGLTTLFLLAFFAYAVAGALDSGPHGRTITAAALTAAYAKNPIAADQIYRGQVFSISGKIKLISTDEALYLDLEAPEGARYQIFSIRCLFANTHGLDTVRAGNTIAITGSVDSLRNYRIIVRDCSLAR